MVHASWHKSLLELSQLLGTLVVLLFVLALPHKARADVASWIVVDAQNGSVLEQYQSTRQWYPASLTKMMTAYVLFRMIEGGQMTLESPITISENAHKLPPSKMGFKPGTQVTAHNALMMIMVKSANDVAMAIGESVAGSEAAFVKLMNQEAQRLGMYQTNFVNAHGLPDDRQVSSARDMAILSLALWNDFPQYRAYLNKPGIRFGNVTMKSGIREYLLRVPGASGIKTGYICNSGYNVSLAATRRGRSVIAVILGSASAMERSAFARQLIETGFDRRQGPHVSSLNTAGALPPPEPDYCKRNEKPDAQQLVDRFGEKRQGAGMLAYANTEQPAPEGISVYKSNNKIDWTLVYNQILGPRLHTYEPYRVVAGLPQSAVAATSPLGAQVPLPKPKPIISSAPAIAPSDIPIPPRKQSYLSHPQPFQPVAGNARSASLLFSNELKGAVQLVDRDAASAPLDSGFFGAPGGLYKSQSTQTQIN
ncbi:D-alanyl-D-alanine carboxypeptidase family protein [Pseudovibrio sp. SPO723]|uniref:D-alanyl-D-alanine carboxypeptidase family protein n=1 Tax=Nesiotobacter zosterae TaxID=392721 RepID=UPI0029C1ECC8|nr:D-alanyl-D-alanine carboxypeptidase family protein [Pseudovibrio sp. SPO723]MDX5595151.1 D-alanyl-D-alanine carboxypeptidase family protein [Pseudovibrio sp. SPO723]